MGMAFKVTGYSLLLHNEVTSNRILIRLDFNFMKKGAGRLEKFY